MNKPMVAFENDRERIGIARMHLLNELLIVECKQSRIRDAIRRPAARCFWNIHGLITLCNVYHREEEEM
jgi:hypothetical protein